MTTCWAIAIAAWLSSSIIVGYISLWLRSFSNCLFQVASRFAPVRAKYSASVVNNATVFPADSSSTHHKQIARSRLSIIDVTSIINITISTYNNFVIISPWILKTIVCCSFQISENRLYNNPVLFSMIRTESWQIEIVSRCRLVQSTTDHIWLLGTFKQFCS